MCSGVTRGELSMESFMHKESNLSAFIYRPFHGDFPSLVRINPVANLTIHMIYLQQFAGLAKQVFLMNLLFSDNQILS